MELILRLRGWTKTGCKLPVAISTAISVTNSVYTKITGWSSIYIIINIKPWTVHTIEHSTPHEQDLSVDWAAQIIYIVGEHYRFETNLLQCDYILIHGKLHPFCLIISAFARASGSFDMAMRASLLYNLLRTMPFVEKMYWDRLVKLSAFFVADICCSSGLFHIFLFTC